MLKKLISFILFFSFIIILIFSIPLTMFLMSLEFIHDGFKWLANR